MSIWKIKKKNKNLKYLMIEEFRFVLKSEFSNLRLSFRNRMEIFNR